MILFTLGFVFAFIVLALALWLPMAIHSKPVRWLIATLRLSDGPGFHPDFAGALCPIGLR